MITVTIFKAQQTRLKSLRNKKHLDMRDLYSILESMADSDEGAESKVQLEVIRQAVKKTLIEFFNYLHIDIPNRGNSLNLEISSLANKLNC